MEPEKAYSKSTGKKRWGRRIFFGVVGLAGAMNLLPGVTWILIFSNLQELWSKFCFSLPYLLPFSMFSVASVIGFGGRLRVSFVLIVLAFVLSAGLFAYDVTYHRAQCRVGADGPYCYVFWWWWSDWWADDIRIIYTR